MNFETTEKIDFYLPKVKAFVEDHVIPVEKEIHAQDRPLEERWQPHPELEPGVCVCHGPKITNACL